MIIGCGATDIVKNAAQRTSDATACNALSSRIKAATATNQTGLVDSGLITSIDNLIGDQARSLLSNGLAEGINMLTSALRDTQAAEVSEEKFKKITDSISARCSEAGVSVS